MVELCHSECGHADAFIEESKIIEVSIPSIS